MSVDVSKNASKLLDIWGEESIMHEDRETMNKETELIYQKISHVLNETSAQKDHEGLDQILQIRTKKLCMRFLTENNSQSSRLDLIMMNCELTNLLYCMLLENDYLQSQVKRLHTKWINEAQCNWKKL